MNITSKPSKAEWGRKGTGESQRARAEVLAFLVTHSKTLGP